MKTSAMDQRVNDLLGKMTLAEKVGQMCQWRGEVSEQAIRAGKIGSRIFAASATAGNDDRSKIPVAHDNALQKIAVEQSRLGIPMIHGRDVIHGHRTVWPIPLGLAATFDPQVVEQGFACIAREARAEGVHWTFTPMLDIARDPRWGRVAEGFGEDPKLCSVLAAASVRGIQGEDPSSSDRMLGCAKHFVGYGGAEGGRDYDTVDIGPRSLQETYLPSFKAAVDAGVGSIMAAFNEVDGVPMHAHVELLRGVLKAQWCFDGFVVSDWDGVQEIRAHGAAADGAEAVVRAMAAGVDMDMVSGLYAEHLMHLVENGRVPMAQVDEAVARILRAKCRLGLFENPYADNRRAGEIHLCQSHRSAAREAAIRSLILLKNDVNLLPLAGHRKIGVLGPLAEVQGELFGTWTLDGASDAVVPIGEAISVLAGANAEVARLGFERWDLAVLHARRMDVNIVVLGEHPMRSGEANGVVDLGLPPGQLELLKSVHRQGKPVVAVVIAGRALALSDVLPFCDALLWSFHPGTEGGVAIGEVLFGHADPGGRLPVCLPRATGQVPIYYNRKSTGRPHDPVSSSRYVDAPDNPLYTFGYGLSYARFAYGDLKLDRSHVGLTDQLLASVTVENLSDRSGDQVVQWYLRDMAASVTRPVRELKAFERVHLGAGERRTVRLALPIAELAITDIRMQRVVEPGEFQLWVGADSGCDLGSLFTVA